MKSCYFYQGLYCNRSIIMTWSNKILVPVLVFTCTLPFVSLQAAVKHHQLNKAHQSHVVTPMSININQADAKTLIGIKGVGVKRAQAIINYRKQHGTFKSVYALTELKGISKQMVDKWLKLNPGRLVVKAK
jgi:competence ComEA-like helix-hairpin-helix protein